MKKQVQVQVAAADVWVVSVEWFYRFLFWLSLPLSWKEALIILKFEKYAILKVYENVFWTVQVGLNDVIFLKRFMDQYYHFM